MSDRAESLDGDSDLDERLDRQEGRLDRIEALIDELLRRKRQEERS